MNRKERIEQIFKHRFFVTQVSYPPQNGFLDYGPPLLQIKHEIHKSWRKILVDENMYEIEPSIMLPYEVLKSSGHIDKFCDVVVTDGVTTYRADHFIEENIGKFHEIPEDIKKSFEETMEKVKQIKAAIFSNSNEICEMIKNIKIKKYSRTEKFSKDIVEEIMKNFVCVRKHLSDCDKLDIDFIISVNNLAGGNGAFFPAKDFNLIFKLNDTQFLRPELAQSQFTSFKKIYDLNNEKMPVSSYSIGRSYRNEISARGGMLRTKEFEQAEIEYFTEDGNHNGFLSVRDAPVLILPNSVEIPYKTTIGEAFDSRIISSEAICYFIAKAQEFLLDIGFKYESLRYRQHNINEMAHYANDCWDVEILTLSGWVECAGIADRSTYDLSCHAGAINPYVRKQVHPRKVCSIEIDKKAIIKKLKGKFDEFQQKCSLMSQETILRNSKDGKLDVEFEGEHYEVLVKEKTVEFTEFIPKVIEPSFGISRILYALVEQSFTFTKDDRTILSLKPKMAYKHCMITCLRQSVEFEPFIHKLRSDFIKDEVRFSINTRSCSIGKRYASCDEIGIPFFVTLDTGTISSNKVTIRERDTTQQISVDIESASSTILSLIHEKVKWSSLFERFKL